MCYSTRQTKKVSELEKIFDAVAKISPGLEEKDLVFNHANGFAHPPMLIIPQENPKYMATLMWGLIPHWESGAGSKEYYKSTIKWGSGLNAKSEKLFSSNMYSPHALTKRCVVPVTGFYEPHTAEKNGKPFKVPFHFERKDKEVISLAGIYAFTNDGYATFTILTKEATPLFAKIHNKKNRRPVILNDDDVKVWLNPNLKREDVEAVIGNDMPDDEINAYPISKDLYKRNVDTNVPEIIEPVHYDEIEIDYENKP
nr:SOS response-associated peptidase [Allomuricauda sp.]